MKIVTIAWLVLAALIVVLHHAAFYGLGYFETPAFFAFTDRFFAVMTEFALFLLFLIPAAISDLAKKGRLWSVIGLAGFWPVVIVTFLIVGRVAPARDDLVVRGLRDRVMRDFKPEELHRFARDVDASGLLVDQDLVNEGDTSGFTAAQRTALQRLDKAYAFMHWLNDGDQWHGPSITNYAQPGVVDFEWGGGQRGRWGCSVSIDGKRNDPPPDPPANILRVSDDIYFYFRQ